MFIIDDFEIHRLTIPLGRTIGDNNCSYDVINLLVVGLKTNQGNIGWGYSESVWEGKFKNDAWYVRQLSSSEQLNNDFTKTWWGKLKNQNPFDLENERLTYTSGSNNIDAAVRLALWDLKAQEKNVPLYKLLNPYSVKKEALAYGSILDFPLSNKDVLDLTQKFMLDGFGILKVKIGADDVDRDIKRLNLIKSYVGNDVKLTADANEAWTWETALDRIEMYIKNDIQLEYLEDPLNRNDIKGFKELTKRSPIPIIGHDYINDFEDLKILVDEGGLSGIRTGKDIDYAIKSIELAKSYNLPVYLGNSMFEVNAHLALAFDQVNRTEYSYLETNEMISHPIVFKNGYIQAPETIGHGLAPLRDKLVELSSDTIN